MKKEIERKEKLLTLKTLLDEFLNNDDCSNNLTFECSHCSDKRLCDNIYRLHTTLNMRYLKK